METFGQRLRRLRENTGLSYESLGVLLGVSTSRIECLEMNYNQPDVNDLERLSQIFNVSLAYLGMFTDNPEIKEPSKVKEVYVAKRLSEDGGFISKKDIIETLYMDRDETHGKDFYSLLAKDDSMSKARIFAGDKLIICRQAYANNGDVVVAKVDGAPEIVRRYKRVGNVVVLSPESESGKYKTLKIDTVETHFLILGVVREVRLQNI